MSFPFPSFSPRRTSFASPLDLPNLNRWYDPSDNATLTIISSEVDVMADKSGNGYSVSAPASTRRCALTTINGIQALNHNQDYLHRAGGGLGTAGSTDGAFTWFEVCQPANTTQSATYHMNILDTNSGTPIKALMQDATLGVGMRIRDGVPTTKDATVTGKLDTTPQILSLICYGTTVDMRRNGVGIITGGDVDVGTIAATRFTIGAQYNGSTNTNFYIGKMGECALCTSALGSTDVANMEAYLAAKWGITI